MRDLPALFDNINTDILDTLHQTVGRGLGVSYGLYDRDGRIIYQHGLIHVIGERDQLNRELLSVIAKSLGRTASHEARKVTVMTGLASVFVAPVPSRAADGAFVLSDVFLSRNPTEPEIEKWAEKYDLKPGKTFRAQIAKAKVLREADGRRIADFLSGVAAIIQHLFAERRRVQKSLSALTALQIISVFTNSSLKLETVLQRVMDNAVQLLEAGTACLMLLDESGQELRASLNHAPAGVVSPQRIPMGDGVVGWVAQEGVPRLSLKEQSGASMVCVPMISKDKIIGVLTFHRDASEDNFDHDDMNVASALASQAAIAIENDKLYGKLRRKVEELSVVFQLGKDINSSLDRKHVLQDVLDNAIKLLSARSGSLMLLHKESQELFIDVANGLPREIVETVRVRLGEGIAGMVAQEGKPRLLHKGVKESANSQHRDLPSALCVPLIVNDGVIGVLNVSDKVSGDNFTEEELELLTTLANQAAIAIENSRLHAELQELFVSSITALANAIDARDPYTRGHSERVSKYSVRIGERLGIEGTDLDFLRYAALLHDVGKIHVRDEILHKPGKLTDDEFQKMKLHPVYGAEIIRPIKAFARILPFIFYHHERFCAMGGYPHGISGTQIPLEARVITVADSYDAMTSTRPYRKAMSVEQAVKELVRWKGTQFDPHVVDIFLQILEEDPELAETGINASELAEDDGWMPAWAAKPETFAASMSTTLRSG